MTNTTKEPIELIPHSFKNARKREKTNKPLMHLVNGVSMPKIDANTGLIVNKWDNVFVDGKPVYTDDIIITYVPDGTKVIPTTLSLSKVKVLVKASKSNGSTFLTRENSAYRLSKEFKPSELSLDDDTTITTIAVKYQPIYQAKLSGITAW